jgi:hypothetical protein
MRPSVCSHNVNLGGSGMSPHRGASLADADIMEIPIYIVLQLV